MNMNKFIVNIVKIFVVTFLAMVLGVLIVRIPCLLAGYQGENTAEQAAVLGGILGVLGLIIICSKIAAEAE